MTENCNISSQEIPVSEISSSGSQTETVPKYPSPNQASCSFTANAFNVCELNMTPDLLNRSFNITLKLLSPGASSGPFCRICHEGDNHEDLASLCKCAGSVGLIHQTCLEKWLNTRRTGHDKCEICNYSFETIRSPKSITEWYRSEQGAMTNRHNVLGDVACFSLITPLAAISIFLCFEGAKRQIIWNNSLEAGCLMALATFLITVYIVWNILTLRYHLKSYFRWRSVNQTVRLIGFRKRSTNADAENSAVDQGNAASGTTAPNTLNENSGPESGSSNQERTPTSESEDVNCEASNLCLTGS